jgi:hypothetical protein
VTRALREITGPFVAAAPAGARVRTRLQVSAADEAVLRVVGAHLGSLAGRDLAARVREGRLDAPGKAVSRRERKRALTAQSSSRWAGAITRTSEDQWDLAERNLRAERSSVQARVARIEARIALPAGERAGRLRGYASPAERHGKLIRLHGLTEAEWREQWDAARLFLTADGEAGKPWGNETIRWHPGEGWLELKLPGSLSHLANRPCGRYRLSCPVAFSYRGDEVAAQAATGAVRYDIALDPASGRWYLDASWRTPARSAPSLGELRQAPVVAVDVNAGHLAVTVVTPDGNILGGPFTVPLDLTGLPAATRDGRLRAAISGLIATAKRPQGAGDRDRGPRLRPGPRGGTRAVRQPPLARQARPGVPTGRLKHPHRQIPGPPSPDDP